MQDVCSNQMEFMVEAWPKQTDLSKKDSANYQEILNKTRMELAQHYLSPSAISQGEIGYLLGYQDGNSFLRAFRSWTGTRPGEYRSEHANIGLFH